jgi:hypothetical protein
MPHPSHCPHLSTHFFALPLLATGLDINILNAFIRIRHLSISIIEKISSQTRFDLHAIFSWQISNLSMTLPYSRTMNLAEMMSLFLCCRSFFLEYANGREGCFPLPMVHVPIRLSPVYVNGTPPRPGQATATPPGQPAVQSASLGRSRRQIKGRERRAPEARKPLRLLVFLLILHIWCFHNACDRRRSGPSASSRARISWSDRRRSAATNRNLRRPKSPNSAFYSLSIATLLDANPLRKKHIIRSRDMYIVALRFCNRIYRHRLPFRVHFISRLESSIPTNGNFR